MAERLKVLVSSYACAPNRQSELYVGWNWVKQISRFHDVWVITKKEFKGVIEEELKKNLLPNTHWIYFDFPIWPIFRKFLYFRIHVYYYLWQIGIYFVAKRLHKKIKFDITHHLTFAKYWVPSFLAFLPVPFVFGPVGGGDDVPRPFFKALTFRSKIIEQLRLTARWFGEHDFFVRAVIRRAKLVFATTPVTKKRLVKLGCRHAEVLSQVAIPKDEIDSLGAIPLRTSGPFRLLTAGRIVGFKAFNLSLTAFARFEKQCPSAEYWFIGEGSDFLNLKRLAKKFGIEDKITFWGRLPCQDVLQKISECDVFLFPSLREAGGIVCAEAMAAGRPVVCLDLGGPALQVTKETGIKIPAVTPEQVVSDLSEAINQLADNPRLRRQMGEAGRRRVKKYFNWDSKGVLMNECYRKILKQ